MAERVEEADYEAEAALEQANPEAVSLAIGRVGRGNERLDAKAEQFLDRQSRFLDLQAEHLHEQRELVLSRLQLGRWKDRVTLALQGMTACVGLLAALGIGWMAWSASQDRGLVIEPFSVPPDLAQKGLTGQALASMLLDKLGEMQEATGSDRAPSTYANNWNDQIKVEIPETGVSVGELQRLLVQWLGHQTSISGELYRTPTGLTLVARTGTAPAKGHAGQEADIDAMVQAAAEDVYAKTQPYRYAVWLERSFDAASVAKAQPLMRKLAASGDPTDRLWARIGLSFSLRNSGDLNGAVEAANAAVRVEPKFGLAWGDRAYAEDALGHAEAAIADFRMTDAMLAANGRGVLTPQALSLERFLARSSLERDLGDFGAAARDGAGVLDNENEPDDDSRASLASDEAFDHDLAAARATAAQISRPAPGDRSTAAANTRGDAAQAQAAIAQGLEDWAAEKAALERIEPDLVGSFERAWNLTNLTPYLALDKARLGDADGARRLITTTPADCYLCVRMRGRIEAEARNWPEADRWFAEAVRQGPSLPLAHVDWARARLARGDIDGALAELKLAVAKGPHDADAWELQGEALMARREDSAAAKAFAQADAYAPKWGRNHLYWGEALMLAGRYGEARAQFETADGLEMSVADRAALKVLLDRTAKGPLHG